jgi:two-component system, NarL family, sensor histidine kinase UhpB
LGLAEALADLVERTRKSQPGVAIDTDIALGATPLSAEVALTLYRAAQEGITNALRHGQAKHLRLAVRADAHAVTLSLHDDGSGLPTEGWQRPGHYGLRWLVERVETLRGELRLEANPPRGVQLHVRVPVSVAEAVAS